MVEMIVAGVSCGAAGIAAWGVIITWRRSNKESAAREERLARESAAREERHAAAAAVRDERLAASQEAIANKLSDPIYGLTAIYDKTNSMVQNCALVSTGLQERVKAAERDISELKRH